MGTNATGRLLSVRNERAAQCPPPASPQLRSFHLVAPMGQKCPGGHTCALAALPSVQKKPAEHTNGGLGDAADDGDGSADARAEVVAARVPASDAVAARVPASDAVAERVLASDAVSARVPTSDADARCVPAIENNGDAEVAPDAERDDDALKDLVTELHAEGDRDLDDTSELVGAGVYE